MGQEEIEREEKEKKKKKKKLRERSSSVSLNFSTIGPAVPFRARDKVDPRGKSSKLRPGTGCFEKLQEVGVFAYSDISYLKSHENGFGSCMAENVHAFQFQGSGTEYLIRGVMSLKLIYFNPFLWHAFNILRSIFMKNIEYSSTLCFAGN